MWTLHLRADGLHRERAVVRRRTIEARHTGHVQPISPPAITGEVAITFAVPGPNEFVTLARTRREVEQEIAVEVVTLSIAAIALARADARRG